MGIAGWSWARRSVSRKCLRSLFASFGRRTIGKASLILPPALGIRWPDAEVRMGAERTPATARFLSATSILSVIGSGIWAAPAIAQCEPSPTQDLVAMEGLHRRAAVRMKSLSALNTHEIRAAHTGYPTRTAPASAYAPSTLLGATTLTYSSGGQSRRVGRVSSPRTSSATILTPPAVLSVPNNFVSMNSQDEKGVSPCPQKEAIQRH